MKVDFHLSDSMPGFIFSIGSLCIKSPNVC